MRTTSTWNITMGKTFSAVTLAFIAITVESSKCATDPTRIDTNTLAHLDLVYIIYEFSYKQPGVLSHVSNLTLWSQRRLARNNVLYITWPMLYCSHDNQ